MDKSDEQIYQQYKDEMDGTAANRRATQNVVDSYEERLSYWAEAYRRGEILPRDVEEALRERGELR